MTTFSISDPTRDIVVRGLKTILVLAAAMALLVSGPLSNQASGQTTAPDALAVLESAAERFAAMSGFCARFDQEVRNDILRQNTRSHGELCQARPDRFAMHFADPAGDLVIADGRDIWIYFPSTDPGQAFRTSMAASEGRFDLHREFLSEPGERYAPTLEGREAVGGIETHRIALEPLRPSPYLRARIWVGTGDPLIHRVEITEDDGLVRILDLSDMRLNPDIPADRFRFDPPDGVQVIVR